MASLETPAPLRSSFTRINKSIYLHEPGTSPTPHAPSRRSSSDPDTILLLAWAAAPIKNVAKYTAQYEILYPRSRILLFTTAFEDLIFHTNTSQTANLAPVVDLLRANPDQKILVHLFSNGGSYKLRELATAYKRTTGRRLPINALIIDSAPGRPHFRNSVAAIKTALPKAFPLWHLGVLLIYMYLISLYAWYRISGRRAITQYIWEALNNTELIDPAARRLYVAAKSDDMVFFEDIIAHAAIARERGCQVRLEEFVGSKHVAHAMLDKTRYWRLVQETW
ncbi:hypothetical protein MMC10_009693 [Thelotrema lepadinum]|nr:hypothetical protein [Thelotrema lepadinum]